MITSTLEWLAAPYLALGALIYVVRFAARRHTHREIDREYEKLCLEAGRDIF